ncbi:MAG: CoA-binding protein [Gammaproteobacteria bacterium]|nr:CoA-binding protein [Gammaproteobacteria bacterium]
MSSRFESFWDRSSYAVVGHSAKKKFPSLTYLGLKNQGKTVYPVDPSVVTVEGDAVYPNLESIPGEVEAVVLELPKDETRDWVARAADRGIKDVWIHMGTETPEALALARERGVDLRHGTCAVMYLTRGASIHALHGWIMKVIGKY